MTSTLDAARAMFEADLASKSLGIELLELAEGRAVLSRIPRQQPHAPPPDLTEDSCSAEEKASEMTPFLPCGIEFPSDLPTTGTPSRSDLLEGGQVVG
jgi:hypothetical protein